MDRMELMYKVMQIMVDMKLPVVFKGALVLKGIINSNGAGYRLTRDIDLNWVNGTITDEELLIYLDRAVSKLNIEGLKITHTRQSDKIKSAGFSVKYNGKKLFSFDVAIKNNTFVSDYNINGFTFTGSSINKIYADKLRAISSDKVFRRAKDIYDLYMMSRLDGYKIDETLKIFNHENVHLGDFNNFIGMKKELKHAYAMLADVVNKPPFDEAYNKVIAFCLPFITGEYKNYNGYWSAQNGMWYQI